MFVYKVLWIFTVKCLQLFNKELYVYFVQVPFCESFRKWILNCLLYLQAKRSSQAIVGLVLSFPVLGGPGLELCCFQARVKLLTNIVTPVPKHEHWSMLRKSLLLSGGIYMFWIRTHNTQLKTTFFSWESYIPDGVEVFSLPLLALEKLQ